MKKTKFLPLFLSAGLILAGCGEEENPYLDTPDKGTVVTKEAVKQTLDDAAETVTTSDAIGVELDNAYAEVTGSLVTEVGAAQIGNISFNLSKTTVDFTASVSDVSFKAGIKGLVTATDPNAVSASASFSSKVKASVSTTSSVAGATVISDTSAGADAGAETTLSANAYLANQTLYADYTGSASAFTSLTGTSSATSAGNTKVKNNVTFPEGTLPLMSDEMVNTLTSYITDAFKDFDDIDENVQYRTHKDGTSSATFNVAEQDGEESTEFTDVEKTVKADYSADLDINALAFTVLFSKDGIKSIGAEADMSLTMDAASIVDPDADVGEDGEDATTVTLTLSLKTGFKFNFTYGDAVVIDTVSDPSSYKEGKDVVISGDELDLNSLLNNL